MYGHCCKFLGSGCENFPTAKSLLQYAASATFAFLLLHILWRSVQGDYDWLPCGHQIYMYCVGSKSSGGEEKASTFTCTAMLSHLSCSLKKQIASLKENGQLLAQKCLWAMFWGDLIVSDTLLQDSSSCRHYLPKFLFWSQKDLKRNSSLKCKEYTSNVPDYCSSGVFPRLLRGGVLFKYLFRRMCSPLMQERFPFPFYSIAVLVYLG